MPIDPDAGPNGGAPKLTVWQRLKYTMVQPDDDPSEGPPADERTAEELEAAIRRSDDKERTIGLVAAPIAAIVGLIISSASVNYAKTHNQSVGVYNTLTYVLLGLSVLILVSSMLRKRMFQGITLALYGLAIFQLHYTYVGFAAPFILAGSWYLVRCLPPAAGSQARRRGVLGPQARPGVERDVQRRSSPAEQALHTALVAESALRP